MGERFAQRHSGYFYYVSMTRRPDGTTWTYLLSIARPDPGAVKSVVEQSFDGQVLPYDDEQLATAAVNLMAERLIDRELPGLVI